MFGLGRDHRVHECPKTLGSVELGKVHQIRSEPSMIHSTKQGFSLFGFSPRSVKSLPRHFWGLLALVLAPQIGSLAWGVPQSGEEVFGDSAPVSVGAGGPGR